MSVLGMLVFHLSLHTFQWDNLCGLYAVFGQTCPAAGHYLLAANARSTRIAPFLWSLQPEVLSVQKRDGAVVSTS